jgi:hypothetical protein
MPASDRGAGRRRERPVGAWVYAGIGSRETPPAALALIESLAGQLAGLGWVLRTGASPGADQAFYRGARAAGGAIELYLPRADFEAPSWRDAPDATVSVLERPSPEAYELAARFVSRWDALGAQEHDLLARDGHQVLGADLASPARLVVCWSEGSLDEEDPSSAVGGSGPDGTLQAIRIARERGIAVLNLARREELEALSRYTTV